MSAFEVGDVCILIKVFNYLHADEVGTECTILKQVFGSFRLMDLEKNYDGFAYQIQMQGGKIGYALPEQLKKKPPKDKQGGIPDSIRQIFTKTQKDPGYTPEKPLRKKEKA